jgi:thiamine-phosphate pyrophosphorylase
MNPKAGPLLPLSRCLLYTFVDTAYLAGRKPQDIARQLCEGGSDLIQLRAKTSTADEIRAMAEAILPVTHSAKVGLVINDHPDIAREVGADFCHMGQEDFFSPTAPGEGTRPALTAKYIGPSRPVALTRYAPGLGLSSHAPAQAERAIAAGADYVAIGPVYPTGTKPGAKPVTLEYVRWAAASVVIPWFAIGGISLQNIDEVLAAGAKRICVVSAILKANDVARTCQQFKERLLSAC